ncbi:ABC transporter permease [Facklamia lactis]|uniref:ABC transporter permease n=1 Tax=Facklamia lactis TaxID=2749967 RepID=UPI0018CED4B3|nr:ABC transporter permease [Facklamia lactis]MBG9980754.1 ABC transporter permease [Facklamia lactis]
MLKHLFHYTPLIMYRNPEGTLWGLLFPIFYAIILLFAFSNLLTLNNEFDPVPVAAIFESEQKDKLQEQIAVVAQEGKFNEKDELIAIETDNQEEALIVYHPVNDIKSAKEIMEQKKLNGYIIMEGDPAKISMEIAPGAINQFSSSILYSVLSSYSSISNGAQQAFMNAVKTENANKRIEMLTQKLDNFQSNPYLVKKEQKKGTSSLSVYFYAALAYICIYFTHMGASMVEINQAYNSSSSLLVTHSPAPKWKRFIVCFIAWGIPCLLVTYLLVGIYYLYGVPLGDDWGRVYLLMTLGVLLGLLIGTSISSIAGKREKLSQALAIGLPLFFAMTSGMMGHGIKITINERAPWINKINPVSLINDGLYYLNNYPSYKQYNQNILMIIVYCLILTLITLFGLRRKDYASL